MKKAFILLYVVLLSQLSFAQNDWQVSGEVTDSEDGSSLPGVSVTVQGRPGVGTITDMDGKYTIKIQSGNSLVFSYIGYKSQTLVVKGSGVLNVVMGPDAHMLDEVVAIGYGTMKKSDLTGAVASVNADQLKRTPAAGMDQALQGKVAGVTVNANSGQPGAAAEIRIRGIGSAIADSRPIFVVDGVITNDISFLSPNDVESTEILKDASACAIFGSRGANGVILVTTKKGKKEKGSISFSSYVGSQNRWNKLDLMKRDEFAQTIMKINPQPSTMAIYQNEGFNGWMKTLTGTSPFYPVNMDYSKIETDWQDEVFKSNAIVQDYYISFDGGNEKSNYAISADYFNQDGTIIGSNYERLTLRINSSNQVRKWLKIGENLSFINSTGRYAMNNSSSAGASILSAAIAMAPWDPTHYPQGAVNINNKDLSGQIAASSNFKNVTNPFSMVENSHPIENKEQWLGNIYVELTPIKNLLIRSAVNIDQKNNKNREFGDAYEYSTYDVRDLNYVSSSMYNSRAVGIENTVQYSFDTKKHNLNLMLGQTIDQFESYSMGGIGSNVLDPKESNWYLKKTTIKKSESSDDVGRDRMFSLLGRMHYTYDNKYMVTANFRADASSKFPDNLWAYFPSTAFAWRMSEEDWMKNISSLDFLKLRLGWGQIGNDKIQSNSFLQTMSQSKNVFTGYTLGEPQELVNGAAVLTYVNNGGKWETTEQWSAGVDFGFFKGLLGGNVDFFIRDTKDMLLYVKAPAQVGNRFDALANVGTARNQGIEISLDHQNKIGGVKYSLGGNASFIKNELIKLNGGSPLYGDRTLCDEGLPLFTLWGYQYEGIYRTNEEALEHLHAYDSKTIGAHAGDARFKDLNNDGKIDDNDKTDLGNSFPWLTYGFNLGVDYRNFDLQVFFQGVYGNKLFNAVRLRTEGTGTDATLSTSMRDVWVDYSATMKKSMENKGVDWRSLINPDGSIPNPNGSSMNYETSSRFVESGAYLRLKNIQLAYTIPRHITEKLDIDRCRFYIAASNLFTFTKYTGYDPEVGSGIDYGNYPQSRTFMLGVNLNF